MAHEEEEREAAEGRLPRVARARQLAREQGGTWPAKRAFADALRIVLARLPESAATGQELDDATRQLRAVGDALARAGTLPPDAHANVDTPGMYSGMETFHDTGPLVGMANPVAPPLELAVDEAAGIVRGTVTFSRAYQGAPGIVHGGFVAAILDELLGLATVFSGGPGMTGRLEVRYRRPTPTEVPLTLEGRLDRVAGRRLHVSGEVNAQGECCAQAEGLFIAVDGEKFDEFNRARARRKSED
jgi:acyl-coenzyme A thioesterase PaaI-like protein